MLIGEQTLTEKTILEIVEPTAQIRSASQQDVGSMHALYSHHVRQGTGSFEESPPSLDEMLERWQQRQSSGYPTVVAIIDGQFAGFAYANAYKERSAYRFTVEDSVYVSPEFAGRGVGSSLLSVLIDQCRKDGYKQMIAVIGDSENEGSIALHRRCGFRRIGVGEKLGYKFGRWLDIVFMQLTLASD